VKHVVFAVPGSLDTPTGGYAYDRRMIAELRDLGWNVEFLNIGEGFPWTDEATRSAARTLLLKVPTGQPIVLDGLALGVLPDVATRQRAGRAHLRIRLGVGVVVVGAEKEGVYGFPRKTEGLEVEDGAGHERPFSLECKEYS